MAVLTTAEAQGHEAQSRTERVTEIVSTRSHYPERVGNESDGQEPGDHHSVDREDYP